jgi:tRNA (mo5U34)-methyltransferase
VKAERPAAHADLEQELVTLISECEARGDTTQLPILLNNAAVVCHASGDAGAAHALYRRSQDIWERSLGPQSARVAQSLNNRAALLRDIEDYAAAEWTFQQALRIWSAAGWPTPADVATRLEPSPDLDLLANVPLWAEQPDFASGQFLVNYGKAIQATRAGVMRGDPKARARLETTLQKLGPWYHNVDLQCGLSTDASIGDYPDSRWRLLEPFVPRDLTNRTVLDIGCNSGYLLLQMAKRSPSRLVGVDVMPFGLAQARFLSHWFEQPLELYQLSAYDIDWLETRFDLIVFVGVLYHLKHPLYALETVAALCKDTMFMASIIRGSSGDFEIADDYVFRDDELFAHPDFPRMYYIEKKYNNDVSNWWFPNRSCLKAMLRTAGFSPILDTAAPEVLVCKRAAD